MRNTNHIATANQHNIKEIQQMDADEIKTHKIKHVLMH